MNIMNVSILSSCITVSWSNTSARAARRRLTSKLSNSRWLISDRRWKSCPRKTQSWSRGWIICYLFSAVMLIQNLGPKWPFKFNRLIMFLVIVNRLYNALLFIAAHGVWGIGTGRASCWKLGVPSSPAPSVYYDTADWCTRNFVHCVWQFSNFISLWIATLTIRNEFLLFCSCVLYAHACTSYCSSFKFFFKLIKHVDHCRQLFNVASVRVKWFGTIFICHLLTIACWFTNFCFWLCFTHEQCTGV